MAASSQLSPTAGDFEYLPNNVCAVSGFRALGKCIGIKSGRKDFAVIHSGTICQAAGVFTKNQIKGAPVLVSIEHLQDGQAQTIIINSGIANVATGQQGLSDANEMCAIAATELGVQPRHVLVASTGVIGHRLPMPLIREGMKGLGAGLSTNNAAAEAILTTDLVKKEIALRTGGFTIGAIAKGSGMIHPNMATMLCFITTDAAFSSAQLREFLAHSVDKSFNMLSVDADTSTSDMVLILSTGSQKADAGKFQSALDEVCLSLAKKIAADGEGATKLIEASVRGAASLADARLVAKRIITSNLFKCAMFGLDPNWGRIMCAIGNSGARIEQAKISLTLQGVPVAAGGAEVPNLDSPALSKLLDSDTVRLEVGLGLGKHEATAFGCDLSYDYVKINSHYAT